MPTSISDFNNHPRYCIERYLKKYECLHPDAHAQKVLGDIRGERIYPRTAVEYLHTAEKWISLEARVVRAGE